MRSLLIAYLAILIAPANASLRDGTDIQDEQPAENLSRLVEQLKAENGFDTLPGKDGKLKAGLRLDVLALLGKGWETIRESVGLRLRKSLGSSPRRWGSSFAESGVGPVVKPISWQARSNWSSHPKFSRRAAF
jgi:hypothetical protein